MESEVRWKQFLHSQESNFPAFVELYFGMNGIYTLFKEWTDSILRGISVQLDLCLINSDN